MSLSASSMPMRRMIFITLGPTWMPAPRRENAGACSYSLTWKPARCSRAAAAVPPSPAPTTAIRGLPCTLFLLAMTQGRWGLGRPRGRPLKTSVHTQNIEVKAKSTEPMENPDDHVMDLQRCAAMTKQCAKTGSHGLSMH
ncbi:hypothetical protein CBM2633_A50109 [Cupriavidus taiwanensis]|nr:hypothetical protein CBM2633_A50109 [Cupriavidus taiwanensis]